MRKQQGFTLVEIAIVLVIIGLLLGGILRGQELIQGARVRNIIDQQNGIKAAFFGFQDRYRGIPGDLTAAQVTQVGGGVLGATPVLTAGNGVVEAADSGTAFQNLTVSGFLACSVCTAVGISTAANSPVNVYGGVLEIVTNGNLASLSAGVYSPTQPGTSILNNIKTGNLIPSNVMAEADVKIDNGNPYTGNLVFSQWSAGSANNPTQPNCAAGPAGAVAAWNNGQAAAPGGAVNPNCGGATKL